MNCASLFWGCLCLRYSWFRVLLIIYYNLQKWKSHGKRFVTSFASTTSTIFKLNIPPLQSYLFSTSTSTFSSHQASSSQKITRLSCFLISIFYFLTNSSSLTSNTHYISFPNSFQVITFIFFHTLLLSFFLSITPTLTFIS